MNFTVPLISTSELRTLREVEEVRAGSVERDDVTVVVVVAGAVSGAAEGALVTGVDGVFSSGFWPMYFWNTE